MKSWLISTVGKLGGYQAARLLTRCQPKILMYHRFSEKPSPWTVSRAGFERQLCMIKRWFHPMTVTQLAELKARGQTPKNAVVITVDDGYRDFYQIAYPLLRHYQVPATFFVTTGFVNRETWLWPDQVAWLLMHRAENLGHQRIACLDLDFNRPWGQLWQALINRLLMVQNTERLAGLVELERLCGVPLPKEAPEEYSASSWTELQEMQENGIEIGGHTYSHPSLGQMGSEEVAQELELTNKLLNVHLGHSPRSFCYPNGSPKDYSEGIKSQVSQFGFTAAVTAFSDRHNVNLNFAWRRFVGTENDFQFHKSLFGVELLGNQLRRTTRCDY